MDEPLSREATAIESVPTDSTDPTDCAAPEGKDTQSPIAQQDDPAYERRRQRILDYGAEHMAEANSLLACLGGVNADLLLTQQQVGETIRQLLPQSSVSIDELKEHSELFDLNFRLIKHITQIAQIENGVKRCEDRKAEVAMLNMPEANKSASCAPKNPR